MPLILSAYLGIAEAARALALKTAQRKRTDACVQVIAGQMETELRAAQIAHEDAIAIGEDFEPGVAASNEMMIRRALVARACLAVVERALEVAGGPAFYRIQGIERMFRDVQASRFHHLQEMSRNLFSGKVALGLDPTNEP
jgi:alkylation response protein AidB-like acyl-CoA dehydrogenase